MHTKKRSFTLHKVIQHIIIYIFTMLYLCVYLYSICAVSLCCYVDRRVVDIHNKGGALEYICYILTTTPLWYWYIVSVSLYIYECVYLYCRMHICIVYRCYIGDPLDSCDRPLPARIRISIYCGHGICIEELGPGICPAQSYISGTHLASR